MGYMKDTSFVQILQSRWKVLIWFTVMTLAVSFVFSSIQTPKYRSSVQILITQKYGYNTDVYSAEKFTEYLSNLLKEVIYSKSFFDQVMTSGFGVKNDFSSEPEKRAKEWGRVVNTKVISNTGIISVNVFHPERDQADRIANAISFIMVTKSDQYHGAGQQVLVKVIDGPTTTLKTVVPNWPLNMGVGLLLGILFDSVFIYMFPQVQIGSRSRAVEVDPGLGAGSASSDSPDAGSDALLVESAYPDFDKEARQDSIHDTRQAERDSGAYHHFGQESSIAAFDSPMTRE
ncbi:hypothetical protein HY224_00230 [Candidatus Uhrbacteria bacterium]|nr:hypothetical protein [Candidatus Uhrbacteria bacterium]